MKLGVNLEQKQVITQQMIQTLKVLEMNVTELENYLSELSSENPAVELEPSEFRKETADIEFAKEAEFERKLEWLTSGDRQNRTYYADDAEERGLDGLPDPSTAGETLAEHLHAQLLLKRYSKNDQKALDFMIHSLDSRGYFTETLSCVSECFAVTEEKAELLLFELQKLDPPGIGARDLKECLLLQLKRRAGTPAESAELTYLAEQLVEYHLEDIAKNHIDIIARKRNVSADTVRAACEEIRKLNPKPGNAFSDGRSLSFVRPDVIVVREDEDAPESGPGEHPALENGMFRILVNDYQYPKIAVNSFYEALEKETDDPEAKKYLREKLTQIAQVRSDLMNRSSTLERVAKLLVEKQEKFFLEGPGHRQPLVLADFSEALSLHESTVSRAMKDKFLQCSWGVFPMNYFLTAAAAKRGRQSSSPSFGSTAAPGTAAPDAPQEADGDLTADQVKRALQEVIASENKAKPLSDEKICAVLSERGISIARRTVNKYRKELGIPDKSGRKKLPE